MTMHGEEMRIKIDTLMMVSGGEMRTTKDRPMTEVVGLTAREMEEDIPTGIGNSIHHLTFVNNRLHFEEGPHHLTVDHLATFVDHRQIVSISNGVLEEVVLEEAVAIGVDQDEEAVPLLNGTTEKDRGISIVVVVGD
jgi:hypothetical protein